MEAAAAILLCLPVPSARGEGAGPLARHGSERPAADAGERTEDGRRIVRAARVPRGPVVDGKLDDAVWEQAEDGGPLRQHRPLEDAEATERTAFRILYDDEALYIGVWCYDGEPEKIVAREMARDGDFFSDDYINFVLDTFLDRRNGYSFKVNPNGAREDGIVTNNGFPNDNWDGIWRARARITPEGWEAEIAIPFKTLSFDPTLDRWGFNLFRMIKRKTEHDRWNAPFARYHTFQPSIAGVVTGLSGLKQGVGLDIIPYALGRYRHEHETRRDRFEGDIGGDVRYRIAPNLQASLSYNTDFAETEADYRLINLTRFPLFFPEKRDFFLEDAGIFSFGGLREELIPFFSRRIGLSESGEIVPLLAAAKLTGRVNSYNIGLIDAYIDDHEGLGEKNAVAARVSKNVFEESSVGMIATLGDPNSDDRSAMGGLDFNYRTTSFAGDNVFEWHGFGLASHTEHVHGGGNLAFGTGASFPNDIYIAGARFYQIEEDFHAALGFVPRKGIRAYGTMLGYRPRPAPNRWVRQFGFTYRTEHTTDLSNELDTAEHSLRPIWIRFESGDEIFSLIEWDFDGPREDFEISEGIVVPAGDYWWNSYGMMLKTASKRPLVVRGGFRIGGFYEGRRTGLALDVDVKPSRVIFLMLGYYLNHVRLPQGNFDTHLARARVQVNFTPDLTWYNLIQYDNVSDTLGCNSRIVWEYHPGAFLYAVLNQNIDRRHGDLRMLESELTLKIDFTFRF